MLRLSEKGAALIKEFEGLRLKAYQCSAGKWTIGWGHTKGVRPTDEITLEQAEQFFREDVAELEGPINEMVKVPMTQGMFDALVSFAFNLGLGKLRESTLLQKLNAGDVLGAANQFLLWTRARDHNGQLVMLPGLIKRRAQERALFLEK